MHGVSHGPVIRGILPAIWGQASTRVRTPASGVGFYAVALVGTLTIGIVVLVLLKGKLSAPRRDDYLLQFNRAIGDKEPPYQAVLDRHVAKLTPVNVRSLGEADLIELYHYVRLKNKDRGDELTKEMNRSPGVQYVNLSFDEEQI